MFILNPVYKLLTWLVLLLGLAGAGAAGYWMKLDIDDHEHQDFVYYCLEIKLKIIARLKAHEQILLSGAAMFDASKNVTRQEWRTYVKRLALNEHFNGIQGLGFAEWIPAPQLLAHINRIRAEGFPDYKLRPEGKREAYTAIIFLEPFTERNLRAFGFDMYSEPVRHAAMERARDEDIVTLSGKVTLVQETDKNLQAGTLMYAPVYKKNKPVDTLEQRRVALFGWVYSPFRMNDLLKNIVLISEDSNKSRVHFRVYEGNNTLPQHLLYDNYPDLTGSNSSNRKTLVELDLNFNGTVWTLQFEQIWGSNGQDYSMAWIVLDTGILISILLFLLLRSYLATRAKAANIAARLTEKLQESERRFRLLADNAPVIIWLAGSDKLCYQFNKVWLDFTGRSLEQEQGYNWTEGVHKDDLQQYLDAYSSAFDARLPFKIEFRLRRYDGEYRWVLNTGVPRFADDGFFLGYIGSCVDITENKRSETELRASEQKLRLLVEQIPLALGLSRNNGEILYINDRFKHLFGYTLDDIPTMAQWWLIAYPDEDYRQQVISSWTATFEQAVNNNTEIEPLEYNITCKNGAVRIIVLSGILFEDGVLVTFTDITELKQAEAQFRIAATVFESQEGMMITDANEVILNVNQAFTLITGYSASEVIGQTPRILHSGKQNKEFYTAVWQNLLANGAWQGEIWNRRKNGEIYPGQVTITAVKGSNGIVTHYVATLVDITERKATEEYINQLAFYDHLTQLPNRRLLQQRLEHGIKVHHRNGSQFALLMMDLDKFKSVNDNLGHTAGDELLQQVAMRIKARLREIDLVARLGGDEFIVLVENIRHREHIDRIAETIIQTISQPFTLCQNHDVTISTSIGISIYPEHGNTIEALMNNADTALYRAKDQGRGCFVYFSEN